MSHGCPKLSSKLSLQGFSALQDAAVHFAETGFPEDDAFRFEVASVGQAGGDRGVSVKDGAGLEDHVAASLRPVGEDGAKLAKSAREGSGRCADGDGLLVKAQVGEDRSGTEMSVVAEHGIADVVVVGRLGTVEKDGVLVLAGIPKDAAATGYDVPADEYPGTKFAPFTNPGRSGNGTRRRQFYVPFKIHIALDVEPRGECFG